MLKFLVTGGSGYVGSVLVSELIADGHFVKCLDRFFFGDKFLSSPQFDGKLELIKDDIRSFDGKHLDDVDVAMDLGSLSNDPVGELDPKKTFEINHKGRVRVASLCKQHGVKHYILPSSASNYGNQEGTVNEESEVFPLTAYSQANHKAELDVLKLNDDNFTTTVLRFSSIYGISPRMRFDLAVNSMALELFKTGKIIVTGDGKQRRPFLHIRDAAEVYKLVINAPKDKVAGQIFNVGSDDQNYEISMLAEEVGRAIGKEYHIEYQGTHDHRSYNASFQKIKSTLGYSPKYSVADGAREVFNALEDGTLIDSIKTKTVEWYKNLQFYNDLIKEVSLDNKIL